MHKRSGVILGMILFLSFFSIALSAEPQTQWLWGEVAAVSPEKNQITLKYLDYENDIEKEITISVDSATTYENVQSLKEIKPQDNLSIDYIVNADGQNLAKNISAEKMDSGEPQVSLPSDNVAEAPKEATGQ